MGKLTAFVGTEEVRQPDEDWRLVQAADVPMLLLSGAKLRTEKGRAEVAYAEGGGVLKILEDTETTITHKKHSKGKTARGLHPLWTYLV